MNVAVLGAGAFGTALAITLAEKQPVTLWARDLRDMGLARENKSRLPGCPFPDPLNVTADITMAATADILLIAVPMQELRKTLRFNQILRSAGTLVACCKGRELETGLGPIAVITQEAPDASVALLTGPSFAADIARGLPTALTLACSNDDLGKTLQETLTTSNLRLYRTTDTVGAELGGALKNIIAIACGVAIGAGLGESARAALMTRGFAEMQRLADHFGADPGTLSGLSGFGDLALTCTSAQSRNYRLGLSIGEGTAFDGSTTVEGASTAIAMQELARAKTLDLPITAAVAALLEKRLDVPSAMASLLARPLKEE